MRALRRKLLRDLTHLLPQVASVALVVACGLATFITMRGAHDALKDSQAAYYAKHRFADVFVQARRAPEELAQRISEIPGVGALQTRVVADVNLDVPGLDEPATARIVSIPGRPGPMLNELVLRSGRWPRSGACREVLLSEAFALANGLAAGARVGAVLQGRWETLCVSGTALSPEYIYEIRSGAILPDNRRFGILWMPREALARAFDMDGAFNDACLALSPGASLASVIHELDRLLAPYGGLGAYGREEQISHRFVSDEIAETAVSGSLLPAIFLGVAAFLVNIVLSRLVATQRSQIAVLKAFGYPNSRIGLHYLAFSSVCVGAGAGAGILMGLWLGQALALVYARYFHFPELLFSPGAQLLGGGLGIAAAAAASGAWLAVRRATRLPPAEAMRPEPPAAFHAGALDRLRLTRGLPPSLKMILRNLLRRPWKAFFSTLGLALSVAILVAGRYGFDALDWMMRLQFQAVQKEDATVLFSQSLGAEAILSLRAFPGILSLEPFREVPARLRHGHRSKRIALQGLDSGSRLRAVVDREFREVRVPPGGVLLSSKLAEILDARPGDWLTAEVLEGARPIRQLQVAALVDDLIGLGATMDRRALDRMLGEGERVSGAYLAVDPLLAARLFQELKRTPEISAISVREAMLQSFRETVAGSLSTSTTTLIAFAAAIAFAMIYNGARISLAERGHELASLRILGFTRREIAALLFGEQALLLLAALPTGFGIGALLCALVTMGKESEMFRLPLVLRPQTFAFATLVVTASAVLSAALIDRRLRRLDLIAVLKSRE